MIPIMVPQLSPMERVLPYLQSMQKNGVFSNRGPLVSEFEKRLADYFGIGSEHVVLCANATLAIQGAANVSNVERYYVPSFTFPASALAIATSKKQLVLADIELESWQIKTESIKFEKGDGIVRVLPFGAPINLNKDLEIQSGIIDAAASFGALKGALGNLRSGWSVIISLHATKVLGVGEGGIAVFGSAEEARRFRAWINFGFEGLRDSLILGINGKMSEISAAFGLAALDDWEAERKEWLLVHSHLANVSLGLSKSSIVDTYGSAHPYWILQFNSFEECENVRQTLEINNVLTRKWWSGGCHTMPAFREFSSHSFPNTQKVAETSLGLPKFRSMNINQVLEIKNLLTLALEKEN